MAFIADDGPPARPARREDLEAHFFSHLRCPPFYSPRRSLKARLHFSLLSIPKHLGEQSLDFVLGINLEIA
jgi:hypothetical protein